MKKPKIAVMLDENTSDGGSAYELSKNYFHAVVQAGGIPYGIPYYQDFVANAVHEFDGFFSVGAGVALPVEWYPNDHKSPYPISERTPVEIGIMRAFLAADKPVFGSCNGMQVLAGIYGCRMRADLGHTHSDIDHTIKIVPGTFYGSIINKSEMNVNSRHVEAVAIVSDQVKICALSEDNIIEAIEIPGKKFAIGLQWHQEDFWNSDHSGNAVFMKFIQSCKG